MNTSSVTIVVPVYNEARIIVKTAETIVSFLQQSNFPYPYELLIVDNASSDDTWRHIEMLERASPHIKGLRLIEKGKGRALRAGFAKSTSDILSFMDADLSSDLASFRPLIDAVASGSAGLAIGNRLGKNSEIVSQKKLRKFASRVYNVIARLFLRTNVDDHQCGFKAITQETYQSLLLNLTDNEFFFDTELIAFAHKNGVRIHQEDIRWIDAPVSTVALFSDSFRMFASIIRLAWRLRT